MNNKNNFNDNVELEGPLVIIICKISQKMTLNYSRFFLLNSNAADTYLQKLCIKCVFVDNEMNFHLSSLVRLLKEEFSVEQQLISSLFSSLEW